jgi:hypothetical protein
MAMTIVAIAAIAVMPACAQPNAAADDDAGGPQNEAGLHGKMGPRAGGQAGVRGFRGQGGQGGQMQGQMGRRARGYIETNDTTKALWDQLGELKVQQHQAQWALFEALNKEGATRETVAPQFEAMRTIMEQMKAINEQLAPYRKQMERPEGAQGQGPRRQGARGQNNFPAGAGGQGQAQ